MDLVTISIAIKDRSKEAPQVNQILGKYGDLISSRLGFHVKKHFSELAIAACISVILTGDLVEIKKCHKELNSLDGVKVKLNIMS